MYDLVVLVSVILFSSPVSKLEIMRQLFQNEGGNTHSDGTGNVGICKCL